MAHKIENPNLISFEAGFCHKCKKFFNAEKTSYCPSCKVCSEDICIITVTPKVELPKAADEKPVIKSITVEATQGYVKERKFYESKQICQKAEQYTRAEMWPYVLEEVDFLFGFISEGKQKVKRIKEIKDENKEGSDSEGETSQED